MGEKTFLKSLQYSLHYTISTYYSIGCEEWNNKDFLGFQLQLSIISMWLQQDHSYMYIVAFNKADPKIHKHAKTISLVYL